MAARGDPQQPGQTHPVSSASESTSWCLIHSGRFSELHLAKGYDWKSAILLIFL